MDAHGKNEDTSFHYSNKICFLSNDDFDYMVAAKHEAEEAIGWKLLPENVVYRVDRMCPIQTKWARKVKRPFFREKGQLDKIWGRVHGFSVHKVQDPSPLLHQRRRLLGDGRVLKQDWTQNCTRFGPYAQTHFHDKSLRTKLVHSVQLFCNFFPSSVAKIC